MGSYIGFGEWMQMYYYIMITFFTKIFQEDILLGDKTKISFDLKITDHKIIGLLSGYLPDFFFGLLMYIILNYRENLRIQERKSNSSEEGNNSNRSSLLSFLFGKANSKEINTDKEDKINILFVRNSNLIHNDLKKNIIYTPRTYLIISCILIVTKEFFSKIIYSVYDIFDNYFLNLIILTLILKFKFKQKIDNHQLLSILIVIFISGCCMLFCLLILQLQDKEGNKNIIDLFEDKWYQILILEILYLVISIGFCIGILIQKYLMEIKFVSPFKIIYFKGIIGILCMSIGIIVFTNLKCTIYEDNKRIMEYLTCSNEYKGNYYYDHFISYFKDSSMNKLKEYLILIIYTFFNFITELSLILINKGLSPTHYLFTESLYSLIHLPLQYIMSKPLEQVNTKGIYSIYFLTKKFVIRSLKFVSSFSEFISYLIYLGIIELKFCGLNENLRNSIITRADNEGKIEPHENSDSDGEKSDNEGEEFNSSSGSIENNENILN